MQFMPGIPPARFCAWHPGLPLTSSTETSGRSLVASASHLGSVVVEVSNVEEGDRRVDVRREMRPVGIGERGNELNVCGGVRWRFISGSAVISVSWHPFANYIASVDRSKKAVVWTD
ncbi:WD domain, G-beta repeat [Nesidiocoris tenuis]|uniref:WD domain, G-beta repeat n=1 Tax=Nesidiocoris tenuis TaxID=355587 RepID=A0ABN7AL95_9HEMI|nr:WD domain, G-beta repeat [Nesidiocoris tenuis]